MVHLFEASQSVLREQILPSQSQLLFKRIGISRWLALAALRQPIHYLTPE